MDNNQPTTLRGFITRAYGNNTAMARSLGVSNATVGTWLVNPRNALRYLPEVCDETGVSERYFVAVIRNTMEEKELQREGL